MSLGGGGWEISEYNGFDQLIKTYKDGVEVDYIYKPDGLRLSKTVDGVKATHLWDDGYTQTPKNGGMVSANLVMELDGNGNVIDKYVYGIGLVKSGNHGYYLYNAHGDVTQLTDSSGNVTKNYHYDAFGNDIGTTQSGGSGSTDSNPFRYKGGLGYYWDAEVGNYYCQSRFYNPAIGRFTQTDPFFSRGYNPDDPLGLNIYSIMQSSNLYVYCGSNPLMFADPNGEFFLTITAIIAIASITAGVAAAGYVGYQSYKYTGKVDWVNAITAGLGVGLTVYTVGMTAYSAYQSLAMYYGYTPVTGINIGTPKVGTITGSMQGLTGAEKTVVNDLTKKGLNVEIVQRGAGKTPDFKVNGIATELKTLQNANVNTGITRIQDAFKQNAQSVIIDARGTGLTTTQAQEMIARAEGTYSSKTLPGLVQVWTTQGMVVGGK